METFQQRFILGYYAELRAAMSFLASEGIGIFNFKHFWFDSQGNCSLLNGPGTHSIVWLAIEKWAEVPQNGMKLLKLFKVQGMSLDEWFAASSSVGPTTSATYANRWLKEWSLDLRILGEDHNLRNEASYRPQNMNPSQQNFKLTDTLNLFSDFWKACEPTAAGRLGLFDLHLLRRTLGRIFVARTGNQPGSQGYAAYIDSTISESWHSAKSTS
ncbi:MAG: hypothetical protein H6647_20850 [Anaerolineales bacterium]|nr:hypothetical protein [Anaerolineales bacterium]